MFESVVCLGQAEDGLFIHSVGISIVSHVCQALWEDYDVIEGDKVPALREHPF
jgi:hypothetical protein